MLKVGQRVKIIRNGIFTPAEWLGKTGTVVFIREGSDYIAVSGTRGRFDTWYYHKDCLVPAAEYSNEEEICSE